MTEENYHRRKASQQQYAEALNNDRAKAPVEEILVQQNGMSRRISVHSLPEKGANTRNEQMLSSTTNEIVRGPNLIESVGDYDYDHADRMKKTIMQEEYKRQLEEAQKLTVPVSMSTARVALMPQIKQKPS